MLSPSYPLSRSQQPCKAGIETVSTEGVAEGSVLGVWSQQAQAWCCQSHVQCETLGKLLRSSEAWFPHL